VTDFDYKKIVRESVEQDPETEEIKEDHLKHIEEISKPKSVLEVKRIHEGEVTVLGTIVSASEMYVVEESDSGSITYKDAKSIQLEDTERPDENERLDVVLYDDMISNVLAGEVVEITGINRIESKRGSKSKKKTIVLHAESIKYLNRKELVITDDDIINFQKFAKLPNLLDRLVSMYAPNIIGHNYVKP
jgi:DNA replicative helicase MCM subunit Mcm2 (Cdc46/Mcm family)